MTRFDADAGMAFYSTLEAATHAQWDLMDGGTSLSATEAIETANARKGPPPQRLIRTPTDAEEAAAAWMRWLGIVDAKATPVGPDEGIDVVGDDAVAQVKAQMVATGRPDVQRLYGAATRAGKRPLFFSLSGYTAGAVEFADATDVALYTFDLQGQPEPVNDVALDLIREYLE